MGRRQPQRRRIAIAVLETDGAVLEEDGSDGACLGIGRAEPRGGFGIHAAGEQCAESRSVTAQNAGDGITGAGDLPGRMAEGLQEALEIEFRRQLQIQLDHGGQPVIRSLQRIGFFGQLVRQQAQMLAVELLQVWGGGLGRRSAESRVHRGEHRFGLGRLA